MHSFIQCLGSGSVGSAKVWLPGSGSRFEKICGSTDPTKNCKKNKILILNLNLNYWKKEIIKSSWLLDGASSFSIKISAKKTKIEIFKFCYVNKNLVNLKKNNLDLDTDLDPDPFKTISKT